MRAVRDHILLNSVDISSIPLEKIGFRCIDERYPSQPAELTQTIAIPGADAGLVLLLLDSRWGLEPEKAVDLVFGLKTRDGGKFRVHNLRDMHCGHCANALENPEAYLLETDRVERAFARLKQLYEEYPDQFEEVMLEGPHQAEWVVFVKESGWTVRPGGRAFVYNEAALREYLNKVFVPALEPEIPGLSTQGLMEIMAKHIQATSTAVAKGKRIIELKGSPSDPVVVLNGRI